MNPWENIIILLYYFGISSSGAVNYDCCASNGEGSGTIWLDEFDCPSDASSISDCSHNGWGSNDCGHSEDVSVTCSDRKSTAYNYFCSVPHHMITTVSSIFSIV